MVISDDHPFSAPKAIQMQKKFALKASLVLASLLGLGAAHAADGTISFKGEVVTSTCEIDVGNSTSTLELNKVATSQLKAPGDKSGRMGFKVSITKCGSGADAPTQIGLTFEPGASVNPATNQLTAGTAAGAATGVEIAILNDQQEKILLGMPHASSKSQFAPIQAGNAVLNYSAEYVATAATVTAGPVNATLTYSLTYP